MIDGRLRDSLAGSEVSHALTLTGILPGGRDDHDHMIIGNHDLEKNASTKDNRCDRRKCAICKMKTVFHCSHAECNAYSFNHARGKMSGVPLCGNGIVRKNLEEYGFEENTRTCMEIHRDNVRETKLKAVRERYGA